MNFSNRAAREPAQRGVNCADTARQNFARRFFLSLKDMTQSIDDLGFNFFFRNCVHLGNDIFDDSNDYSPLLLGEGWVRAWRRCS